MSTLKRFSIAIEESLLGELERMVSKTKDSIGAVLARREGLNEAGDPRLVGFRPVDRKLSLTAGAHFIGTGKVAVAANDEGYLSSVAYSPNLGHYIGLGFLNNGAERMGETIRAVNLLGKSDIEVEVVSPHFIDPEGGRLHV